MNEALNKYYPGYDDNLPRKDYLVFTERWLAAAAGVLSPSGSLFVQIKDEWAGYVQVFLDRLLHWRNTIIWYYRFGTHQKGKFGRNHQVIFHYVADPQRAIFNADAVREPSDRQVRYKDKRADLRGRVPGDVWEIPRVCGTFRERTGHCCQTPLAILSRIILATTNPGNLVIDSFAGSGTTLVAARQLQRQYLGIEVCEATAELARRRRENACKTTNPPAA
jgi:site-specific DNA-methyltransferase (adenine-specific)